MNYNAQPLPDLLAGPTAIAAVNSEVDNPTAQIPAGPSPTNTATSSSYSSATVTSSTSTGLPFPSKLIDHINQIDVHVVQLCVQEFVILNFKRIRRSAG
jgi:hypothetical protein